MSAHRDWIATVLHIASAGESSSYPSTGKKSDNFWFQKIYWQCVVVFFSTSRVANPNARYVFFTNIPKVPAPYAAALQALGVETITLPFTYAVPEGYWHQFTGVFFKFDCLKYRASHLGDDEIFLLLDSDVVFLKNGSALIQEARARGGLQLDVRYAEDSPMEGMTRIQAKEIYDELFPKDKGDVIPPHFGAEIVCFTGKNLRAVLPTVDIIYRNCMERFKAGLPKINTEEAIC